MKILFVNWKDINHPQSGGAEVVLWQILKRLVQNGYQVSLLTAVYQKNGIESPEIDNIDGIRIFRTGKNKFLHSIQANLYYQNKLKNEFDLVVEMVNTAPYFLGFNIFWNNFWRNLKYKIQNKFTKKSNKNNSNNLAKSENLDNWQNEKLENNLEKKVDLETKYKPNFSNSTKSTNFSNSNKNTKFFLFYHQLAREIWWLETKFPINWIGFFLLEPIATFVQSRLNCKTITVSNSSKNDLVRFGFDKNKIAIISEGIDNQPLKNLSQQLPKDEVFTVLYHGSLRPMKRPIEVLKSFAGLQKLIQNWQNENPKLTKKQQENKSANQNLIQQNSNSKNEAKLEINTEFKIQNLAKTENQENQTKINSQIPCQLWISGGGELLEECKTFCRDEKITDLTTFFGRTSDVQKLELMQKSSVLVATSLKEGWGLIVTEGNSMGTPAVVYDVDGLRDSGSLSGNFVVKTDSNAMAKQLFEVWKIWQFEKEKYLEICEKALNTGQKITFQQCFEDFEKIITN